jgi:TPP-dependent pyruvate/acetoin dehydrogenase alpha subunit
MSQSPNAERQIWIFTQMLRIRTFEERVKRAFTEHAGVIGRLHRRLAQSLSAGGRGPRHVSLSRLSIGSRQ